MDRDAHMERQRLQTKPEPGYPSVREVSKSIGVTVGAGLLAMVASAAGIQACGDMAAFDTDAPVWDSDTEVVGDTNVPGWDSDSRIVGETGWIAENHPVDLPSEGSRELVFPDDQVTLLYNVVLLVQYLRVVEWFEEHPEEALASIDQVLLGHELAELPVGEGDDAIEAEIRAALEALWDASGDIDTEQDVLEVTLTVLEIRHGQE